MHVALLWSYAAFINISVLHSATVADAFADFVVTCDWTIS